MFLHSAFNPSMLFLEIALPKTIKILQDSWYCVSIVISQLVQLRKDGLLQNMQTDIGTKAPSHLLHA